jgi:filamentous hemagglutinin
MAKSSARPSKVSPPVSAARRNGAAVLSVAVASVLASAQAAPPAPSALPVPCATGACGKTGPSQFVTVGQASATKSGNQLNVLQSSNNVVLNWSSFNIGANGQVVFKQPSSSSIALNRIYQGDASQIFGQLSSNGQVFLVNLNGFLFGAGSKVNVGGLLVSSLPMADSTFANGILSPLANHRPALGSLATDTDATYGVTARDPYAAYGSVRASVLDSDGKPVLGADGQPLPVSVTVQSGAALTATGGRVLLAGQSVTNAGSISTPDGQTVLAAGERVYLQASSDPSLRGLVVEVDKGGAAWNQLSGQIAAPRGNITMVGFAVNQEGRLSATTTVAANGSIRLEAADTAFFGTSSTNSTTVASSHGGLLTVGTASSISVLPELDSTATAVDAQTQLVSDVKLLGEQVFVRGGSIEAPGGNVSIIAAANPTLGAAGSDAAAKIRIDPGAVISVAGSESTLPMAANLVTAQLRANEFADDPTQRNGNLRGQTVVVDARIDGGSGTLNGTPSNFANLSGQIAAVPRTIAQRTAAGGNVAIAAEGDVAIASGSAIDVSGGVTHYQGGIVQTTFLRGADGVLYPIATADPLKTYVGVVNPTFGVTYDKWGVQEVVASPGLSHFEAGYDQGAAAGTLRIAGPRLQVDGTLRGHAINGPYQRTASTAVQGGLLEIGTATIAGDPDATGLIAPGAITFSRTAEGGVIAEDMAPASTLQLPVDFLTSGGFTRTKILSAGEISLPVGLSLSLAPGSSFQLTGARIDLDSSVTAPGGSLGFTADTSLTVGTPAFRPGVYVGEGVTLDASGRWTNDLGAARSTWQPLWRDGGSIALRLAANASGGELSFANGDTLDVSGGASLDVGGALVGGKGGSLTIAAGAGAISFAATPTIAGFGVNGAAGGTFALSAPRLKLDSAPVWAPVQVFDTSASDQGFLELGAPLFSSAGFRNFTLTAAGVRMADGSNRDVLEVAPGTALHVLPSTLVLTGAYYGRASGASLASFTSPRLLPVAQRPAGSLTLSALPSSSAAFGGTLQPGDTALGDLVIGVGSSIEVDPLGSVTLRSARGISIAGRLTAPGGSISATLATPRDVGAERFDAGFLADQKLELLPTGVLDVAGTTVLQTANPYVHKGTVLDGGQVTLAANRGAVYTDPGSRIDVSGTSADLDVSLPNATLSRVTEASAAGGVTINSGEAVSLLGTLNGHAGGAQLAGGTLAVTLSRELSSWDFGVGSVTSFNPAPLEIRIVDSTGGTFLPATDSNRAYIDPNVLAAGGIDALRLTSSGSIRLESSTPVSLGRELTLDSRVLAVDNGAAASLSAPYVRLGYSGTTALTEKATAGAGSVTVRAAALDVIGHSVTQGAGAVTLDSSGDLRLVGTFDDSAPLKLSGGLAAGADLNLEAARVYATTASTFAVSAGSAGSGAALTIGQSASRLGTPLSADSRLSFTADQVTTNGSIYAPFGQITFNAGKTLTLGDGSLTSVSADGLSLPFGQTQLGARQWIYSVTGTVVPVTGVPTRAITLSAPTVTLAPKSTVDLRGGGDLQSYEWVPGSGGTKDALAPGVTPGLYAVLPSLGAGQLWPGDSLESSGYGGAPNGALVWSGGGGLAAGTYALLPARYALLPNAYLVQLQSSFRSPVGGVLGNLADGTPIVGGAFAYGASGLRATSDYLGFSIRPGSYGQQLAEYALHPASTYFAPVVDPAQSVLTHVTTTADAGSLVLAATTSLDALGAIRTGAGSGGRAATIDLSASDLYVGNKDEAPVGAVVLSDTVLSSWAAGSLVIGGTAANGNLAVSANTVTLGNGAHVSADEVILVAANTIDLRSGSVLSSTSAAGTAAPTLPAVNAYTMSGNGNGKAALVAVSDVSTPVVTRAAGAGGGGIVNIESGASVASKGALAVDAPGGAHLDGTLTDVGGSWSLGAASIDFARGTTSTDAMTLSPALLAQLNAAGAVRLAATSSIDFDTSVSLGVPGADGKLPLTSLTLSTPLVRFTGTDPNDAKVQLAAQTVTLAGPAGAAAPAVVAGTAPTLDLRAGELDVGPGSMAIGGFAGTTAEVAGAVIGRGTGALRVAGDLGLTATEVTAATGADTSIVSTGALAVHRSTSGAAPQLLAGSLALGGATVLVDGTVQAVGGNVALTSSGAMTIASGGVVSAAGQKVDILGHSYGTTGGNVSLTAGGDLTLASKSLLDVSGSLDADAGRLALASGGSLGIGGTLRGASTSTAGGGQLIMSAQTLSSGLTGLATTLTGAGFSREVSLHVRGGDLALDPGAAITANALSIVDDVGRLSIGGTLSAPSLTRAGSLRLYGGNGVELTSTGALHADAATASARGGSIEIGTGVLGDDGAGNLTFTSADGIRLDAGSVITAIGGGRVLLRAPALLATNDVAIGSIDSQFSGISSLTVEPVLVFSTVGFSSATAPTLDDWQAVHDSVDAYMSAAGSTISARLGKPSLVVQAGAEVVAEGDLTLNSDGTLDLGVNGQNWRFGNGAVDLAILARGNLRVSGTLTDGFDETLDVHGDDQWVLSSGPTAGPSSTFRLVAGADLNSADPLAVQAGGTGKLSLDGGIQVRTGTGDIDLAAASDIVINKGASVFTAGLPTPTQSGTADDPYPNVPTALGTSQPFGIAVNPATSGLVFSFPSGGGNLSVVAGRDVVGTPLTDPAVSYWLLHQGGYAYTVTQPDGTKTQAIAPAQWAPNLNAFHWSFGTLGGGDVTVRAGRDATNVTAAASGSRLVAGETPLQIRSGALDLIAGRDVGSSQFYLSDGAGQIRAGRSLVAVQPTGTAGVQLGAVFYVQDSAFTVDARTGIAFDGLLNSTALPQPLAVTGARSLAGVYFSYADSSALTLRTTSGDVVLGNAGSKGTTAMLGPATAGISIANARVLAPSLTALALDGSVRFGTDSRSFYAATLYPSTRGGITLAATGDVAANGVGSLVLSDAALFAVPSVDNPAGKQAINDPFDALVHTGDPTRATVLAGNDISQLALSLPKAADIEAGRDITNLILRNQNLASTDTTLIAAGRDFTYTDSCTSGCQITTGGPGRLDIIAGRNLDLAFASGITTTGNIFNGNLPATGSSISVLTGAGARSDYPAVLDALVSTTDTAKDLSALQALEATGSVAGLPKFLTDVVESSAAYASKFSYFVRNVVQHATGTDPGPLTFAQANDRFSKFTSAQQQAFITEMAELIPASATGQTALVSYVASVTGSTPVSASAAHASFAGLSAEDQRAFVNREFFSELTASGRDNNNLLSVGFSRGYSAVDAYYPQTRSASPDYSATAANGDLGLVFSRIYTLSGGDIELSVPGGLLNVGLANAPPSLGTRDPSTLGIVAQGSGSVDIYSRGDVLVSSSRVFTLGGGDILIWSNEGSIDAGRGAKSAVSAPPPQVIVGADGSVRLSFAGAASGSGIRTIQTDPAQPLGNVDLIAPVGSVNAGDAGIGAAGNINIAASRVLGLDNIQVGGTSTGVPAQVSSLGASLLGASNAASSSTQSAQDAATSGGGDGKQGPAPLADAALGWLEVFVTGLGEEACKPDDIECLKRQKRK